MAEGSIVRSLDRIEAALDRVEAATLLPPKAAARMDLEVRHEQLRSSVEIALLRIDALLGEEGA